MRLTAEQYGKIVETLVEKLNGKKLLCWEVSSVLFPALEQHGMAIGDDLPDGDNIIVPVKIDVDIHANLLSVIENCNQLDKESDGQNTHGKLDVSRLLAMLAEDVAMINNCPERWEASKIQHVLACHGYS